MNILSQSERLKKLQRMIQIAGGENTTKESQHIAAQKYFTLFVHDWAESHQLDAKSQESLVEILRGFYCFVHEFAENNNLNLNSQEMLIEILKDSFFFIQKSLEENKC